MSSTRARRERRRLRPKRGRREGSHVRLSNDPHRFALAVWFALNEIGLGPYVAGFLTVALIDSDDAINLESIEDDLVQASAGFSSRGGTTLVRRSDWLVRRAEKVFSRARGAERRWLVRSGAGIRGVIETLAEGNTMGAAISLGMLVQLGWSDVIEQLRQRFDAAARSNLPPADGKLSAAARRLLALAREQRENGSKLKAL